MNVTNKLKAAAATAFAGGALALMLAAAVTIAALALAGSAHRAMAGTVNPSTTKKRIPVFLRPLRGTRARERVQRKTPWLAAFTRVVVRASEPNRLWRARVWPQAKVMEVSRPNSSGDMRIRAYWLCR